MPAPAAGSLPVHGIGSCWLIPRGCACLWHPTHPGRNGRWPRARISGWDEAPWPVPPCQLSAVPRGSGFAIRSSGSGSHTSSRSWQRHGSLPAPPAALPSPPAPGKGSCPSKVPISKKAAGAAGTPSCLLDRRPRNLAGIAPEEWNSRAGRARGFGRYKRDTTEPGTVATSGYFLEVFGYF